MEIGDGPTRVRPRVETVLRWLLKKTDMSFSFSRGSEHLRFLPVLPPPPPPSPFPPSSSTEDDGVLYSLRPRFAASSISLSFSFSPDCPGMNGRCSRKNGEREGVEEGRRKRRRRKRQRGRGRRERLDSDDGFGETRSNREGQKETEGERGDRWLPW